MTTTRFLLSLSLLFSMGFGLNENIVKELNCVPPPPAENVGLNLTWFGSITKWYLPFWSKLYATRVASDQYQIDASQISDHNINANPACLVFSSDMTVSAFGHKHKYNITGDASGITFRAPWSGAKSGTFAFHKTNNKDYLVGVTCWEDNEGTWAALTTKPELSRRDRYEILQYVKSLGFQEDNVADEDYSLCGNRRRQQYQVWNRPNRFYQPQYGPPQQTGGWYA